MRRFVLVVLLGFIPQLALSQADPPPFTKMMTLAKVKKVIQVDTPGGCDPGAANIGHRRP